MAGVKTLDIGRIGDRYNHDDWAVGVDGISADDHDRPSPRLLAAFGGVKPGAEHVTANGFWQCGSLAVHVLQE